MRFKDLVGQRFGEWTVLRKIEKSRPIQWIVRCSCGTEKTCFGHTLVQGRSLSCGCKANENAKKTNLEKYGVEWQIASNQTKEAIKETMIDRYGVDNSMKIEATKDKMKATNIERYGVDNYAKTQECQDKMKATSLERYGVENYTQTQEWKDKYVKYPGLLEKCKTLGIPYSTYQHYALKYGLIPDDDVLLNKALSPDGNNLERTASNLFGIEFLNKKIHSDIKYRPDFKVSDSVYVNTDGLFWHSEINREDKSHHRDLRVAFENVGLRILQFYDYEIYEKPLIVKSIVNNTAGKCSRKLNARECDIKAVSNDTAIEFLKNNHLMGPISSRHMGLFMNEELVSILSYKVSNGTLDIDRFCSKVDIAVRGGFSKLIHVVTAECKPNEIVSFVDMRYGNGISYEKLGFTLESEHVGWMWTDCSKAYNRRMCKAGDGLTEAEQAAKRGWYKIYDAGQRKYVKKLS